MDFLLSILKVFLISLGAILPGVSSGVLCVIFGIYEKLVDSFLSIFKDFKKNFAFLLPIIIGIVIGFFIFGSILNSIFNSYNSECKSLFLGIASLRERCYQKKKKKEESFCFKQRHRSSRCFSIRKNIHNVIV